jgi:hypothetical protein
VVISEVAQQVEQVMITLQLRPAGRARAEVFCGGGGQPFGAVHDEGELPRNVVARWPGDARRPGSAGTTRNGLFS